MRIDNRTTYMILTICNVALEAISNTNIMNALKCRTLGDRACANP